MEKMALYKIFEATPKEARKAITAGRLKGFTDINPMYRIRKLTEVFGPVGFGWYYKVTNKWLETVGEEVCAFVDLELYVNTDGQWSMPIYGTGGSKLATKEKTGVYVSDEAFKMATTDALSVACKSLGIGADVYWEASRNKYSTEPPKAPDSDAGAAREASPERINGTHWATIQSLAAKKGVSEKSIIATYKVLKPSDLTIDNFRDVMDKLRGLPDKVAQ